MNALTQKGKVVKTVATATAENKNLKNETMATGVEKVENEKLTPIYSIANAEQRIKNLEILQKMADKHKFLKEKRDSLNAFIVARDGMKERLIIMNDNNENFEITNGVIITELLDICSQKLDEMLEESNKQITAFQI